MLIKFIDGTERGVEIKPDANLSGADLCGADLHGANLRRADLSGADLCGADLRGANLRSADLRSADLRSADLRNANLHGADLCGADLSGADLSGADLSGADLCNANLHGAYLRGAYLSGADLSGAKGLAAFKVCPEVGQFVGFKKVNGSIITLLIPADAKRVNTYGSRKCRAEFAHVLHVDMRDYEGRHCLTAHNGFIYPTSGLVTPDSFDPDPRVECSHGIHFFMTRDEAVEY
jgi:hypothetical protein